MVNEERHARIAKVDSRMKEAGKRCLLVTRVQVQKAPLSAKAKTILESDQGSERISSIARNPGQETHVDY